MLRNFPVLKILVILLAIIGGFALAAFVGMVVMHGSMMGMMNGRYMAGIC